MTKVYEMLGLAGPVSGDVGIEVEIENVVGLIKPLKNWKAENDGSLRGGVEYITRGAVNYGDVKKELTLLFSNMEKDKVDSPCFSPRTSIHFHINVTNLDKEELKRVYLAHVLLDVLYADMGGEARKGNLFCNRVIDAPGQLETALHAIKRFGRGDWSDRLKYSCVNLAPVFTQGSLEFRSMEGTADIRRIVRFLEVIKEVTYWAVHQPSALHVYNFMRERSLAEVVQYITGVEMLSSKLEAEFQRTLSLSLDFAYRV